MADKTILIIGAGIAGLCAGCYGQMNGYRTRIFELHDKPGGLCTSWKRQGYVFDGCIHWLVGSGPGTGLYRLWQELGAVQGRRMVDHDEFTRYEGAGGRCFIVYTDVDRLERHMKELAPQDAPLIEELTGAYMSVYGNTVAVIGDSLQIEVARRAVDMLLSGSEHAAVYHFLEGRRAQLKIDGMGF